MIICSAQSVLISEVFLGVEGRGMNPVENVGSDDRFSFFYESVTLSTATKSHICTDFQLLESFTG